MTMNIRYYFVGVLFALTCLASCKQEEVKTFTAERGINFVLYDSSMQEYEDDYEKLSLEHNFFEDYAEQSWNVSDFSQEIGIQLEGTFSDEPIAVKVKAEAVDGYELPELDFPSECVIEAGEARAHFTVVCKKPTVYDKVYKAKLVFDYAASKLVAGTKERQSFDITISDASAWEDMYVSNEAEWNSCYSSLLGTYGPVKGRFIFISLGTSEDSGSYYGESYKSICQRFYNQKNGWGSNGFNNTNTKWYMNNALDWYWESHGGVELAEADGTPVTFNF